MENPGDCVLYYLKDRPERAFVKEELMLIPQDTKVPSEKLSQWNYFDLAHPEPQAIMIPYEPWKTY